MTTACKSFSPHLWQQGICRECNQPQAKHGSGGGSGSATSPTNASSSASIVSSSPPSNTTPAPAPRAISSTPTASSLSPPFNKPASFRPPVLATTTVNGGNVAGVGAGAGGGTGGVGAAVNLKRGVSAPTINASGGGGHHYSASAATPSMIHSPVSNSSPSLTAGLTASPTAAHSNITGTAVRVASPAQKFRSPALPQRSPPSAPGSAVIGSTSLGAPQPPRSPTSTPSPSTPSPTSTTLTGGSGGASQHHGHGGHGGSGSGGRRSSSMEIGSASFMTQSSLAMNPSASTPPTTNTTLANSDSPAIGSVTPGSNPTRLSVVNETSEFDFDANGDRRRSTSHAARLISINMPPTTSASIEPASPLSASYSSQHNGGPPPSPNSAASLQKRLEVEANRRHALEQQLEAVTRQITAERKENEASRDKGKNNDSRLRELERSVQDKDQLIKRMKLQLGELSEARAILGAHILELEDKVEELTNELVQTNQNLQQAQQQAQQAHDANSAFPPSSVPMPENLPLPQRYAYLESMYHSEKSQKEAFAIALEKKDILIAQQAQQLHIQAQIAQQQAQAAAAIQAHQKQHQAHVQAQQQKNGSLGKNQAASVQQQAQAQQAHQAQPAAQPVTMHQQPLQAVVVQQPKPIIPVAVTSGAGGGGNMRQNITMFNQGDTVRMMPSGNAGGGVSSVAAAINNANNNAAVNAMNNNNNMNTIVVRDITPPPLALEVLSQTPSTSASSSSTTTQQQSANFGNDTTQRMAAAIPLDLDGWGDTGSTIRWAGARPNSPPLSTKDVIQLVTQQQQPQQPVAPVPVTGVAALAIAAGLSTETQPLPTKRAVPYSTVEVQASQGVNAASAAAFAYAQPMVQQQQQAAAAQQAQQVQQPAHLQTSHSRAASAQFIPTQPVHLHAPQPQPQIKVNNVFITTPTSSPPPTLQNNWTSSNNNNASSNVSTPLQGPISSSSSGSVSPRPTPASINASPRTGPINTSSPRVTSLAAPSPRASPGMNAYSSPRVKPLSSPAQLLAEEQAACVQIAVLDEVVIIKALKEKYGWTHDEHCDYFKREIHEIIEDGIDDEQIRSSLRSLELHQIQALPYELVSKLGIGGFGAVYKALSRTTQTMVAIKIMELEDTTDISLILREVHAISEGNVSQQLTHYYESIVLGTKLFLVMEYVDGGSVLDIIKSLKEKHESSTGQIGGSFGLDEKYIAIIVREILLGLAFLESQQKLHRDIKCANILLSRSTGQVKLADFGASRQLTDTMTKANTFIGSPYWIAPEIMMEEEYDGKADIWSVGITSIEMAHGAPPHFGIHPLQAMNLITTSPPPMLEGDQYSKLFKEFVAMCCVKQPSMRPSVHTLLKHPFVKKAKPTKTIKEMFENKK